MLRCLLGGMDSWKLLKCKFDRLCVYFWLYMVFMLYLFLSLILQVLNFLWGWVFLQPHFLIYLFFHQTFPRFYISPPCVTFSLLLSTFCDTKTFQSDNMPCVCPARNTKRTWNSVASTETYISWDFLLIKFVSVSIHEVPKCVSIKCIVSNPAEDISQKRPNQTPSDYRNTSYIKVFMTGWLNHCYNI